jgi:hypothetical protein
MSHEPRFTMLFVAELVVRLLILRHLIGTYVSCSSPDKDHKTHLVLAYLLVPVSRIDQCGRQIH